MFAKPLQPMLSLSAKGAACELIPYQSTLVVPPRNTVEKFRLLPPSMLKFSVFRFKNKVLTSSLQTMEALIFLRISWVSYVYIHMAIIAFIPTHSPANMSKQYLFFVCLFLIPVGEMAEDFRVNSQKYLPKADSTENFGQNDLSLAKP